MPLDEYGYALGPGLITGKVIENISLEFPPLCPAQIHAQEDVDPVLSLGSAGTGMDGKNGIAGIMLAAEHALYFSYCYFFDECLKSHRDFVLGIQVIFLNRHIKEHLGFVKLIEIIFPGFKNILQAAMLLVELLRPGLIVPEIRGCSLFFQLCKTFLLAVYVKDAPSAQAYAR